MTPFSRGEEAMAGQCSAALEHETCRRDDVFVVLVCLGSVARLHEVYPNYVLDAALSVRTMQGIYVMG